MTFHLSLSLLFCFLACNAFAVDYPKAPHEQLTPGSLCTNPTSYRYPERIAYCERDVSSAKKDEIFSLYRSRLGFKLAPGTRSSYKIDHFIPLCAGGSNNKDNLWPQHISLFTLTDPIEGVGCEKLKEGRISQRDFINLIKEVKYNISEASSVLRKLQTL